jgi:hypothetical protein
MRKVFLIAAVLCAFLMAITLPSVVLATSSGGSANHYVLVFERIKTGKSIGCGTLTPWDGSETPGDSVVWTLQESQSETTGVYNTGQITCPFAGGVYMGFTRYCATADSLLITPQVSFDKTIWLSLAAVTIVPGAATSAATSQYVEAATLLTTPAWPFMRFIFTDNDSTSQVSQASNSVWFQRFEKAKE